MTEILLVRHGQSIWNAQGKWQGQADPPLSPLGLQQAAAAGDYLATQESFDSVASSTLDRAATTASVIADKLGHPEPERHEDLVERNVGEWSGLTRAEVDEQYPGFLSSRKFPPGYEADSQLLTRIDRAFAELTTKLDGERMLFVAHGGIVYAIEKKLGLRFSHMSNLGARWLTVEAAGAGVKMSLGPRIDLLVNFAGEHTTPTAI